MSLFLGPIHYWLYNKITLQNKIVNTIIKELNLENIESELCKNYGLIVEKPLEQIINTENIHGWLQEKVDIVENRLAYVVKLALEKNQDNLNKIEKIFFDFGASIKIEGNKDDASIVFKTIEDSILDGMPCDRTKKVIEKNENIVSWTKNICVHEKYWNSLNIDINIYYKLINQFILGVLSNTKLTFEQDDELNLIK